MSADVPRLLALILSFFFFFLSPAAVPEVKVSEQTPSDELARKMRHYSGRSEYMWGFSITYVFLWIDVNEELRAE